MQQVEKVRLVGLSHDAGRDVIVAFITNAVTVMTVISINIGIIITWVTLSSGADGVDAMA
jgi:sorbitol-specific phosphotransferase system component IIBC